MAYIRMKPSVCSNTCHTITICMVCGIATLLISVLHLPASSRYKVFTAVHTISLAGIEGEALRCADCEVHAGVAWRLKPHQRDACRALRSQQSWRCALLRCELATYQSAPNNSGQHGAARSDGLRRKMQEMQRTSFSSSSSTAVVEALAGSMTRTQDAH
jgi:hypothetical protein